MNIRPAQFSDIEDMLNVKRTLVFSESQGVSFRGGFLLGTDAQGYRIRIAQGLTWVIDDDGVKGFSIMLPDQALRASDIWSRRNEVQWSIDPNPVEQSKLGYYDQLAVIPGPWRSLAPVIAIVSIMDFMRQKPDYVISSTVIKPVTNLAAVPYLQFLGGTQVGILDEVDPVVGQLVSDIWLAPRSTIEAFLNTPPSVAIGKYVQQAKELLHKYKV
ncbi:MAG: hypothetical protein CL916_11475 [Deltaproteobacteria bacterium]|nr:hypothetical protein [Deltaproteobacteria bacterium]